MPLSLSQTQQQKLILAPQMRQNLALLQATTLSLAQQIRQAADTNPALLIREPYEHSLEARREAFEKETSNSGTEAESISPGTSREGIPEEGTFRDEDFYDGGNNEYDPDREERRRFFLDSIPARESLQQHLLLQLESLALGESETALAELIIGSLDEKGYLRTPLAELAQGAMTDLPTAEKVLSIVQEFDPPGIAARSPRECLLLQLEENGTPTEALAKRILSKDELFEALALRKFDTLSERIHATPDACENVLTLLRRLDPYPGLRFDSDPTPIVRTEISVVRKQGRWIAQLDTRDLPEVSLDPAAMERLRELRQEAKRQGLSKGAERDIRAERDWWERNVREGELLLAGLRQRQITLLQVAQAIVDRQQEFFDRGREALKPLVMADVAAAVGVHEATISRAVSGKFLKSPQGTTELRSFFTNGVRTANGGTLSSDSVQERIRVLIAEEDSSMPLSDDAIMRKLESEGIAIKRRTVAKYRDQLGIPSSTLRKR